MILDRPLGVILKHRIALILHGPLLRVFVFLCVINMLLLNKLKFLTRTPHWFNDDYFVLRKKLEQTKIRAENTKSLIEWDVYRDF